MNYRQMFQRYSINKGWIEHASVDDSILFLCSEVGEVCDARLRGNTSLIRNNEREVDIGDELADVVFMAFKVADALSLNLDGIIMEKFNAKSSLR